MAVSYTALIPRVKNFVDGDAFATQGSAASASSVVAVTDGTDWEEGAVGEFQDDGEQFKVISVAGNDLTCIRGWNGTTAATHAASTTILRGFQYSYQQIYLAIHQALHRLWPYAWKLETDSITPVAGQIWYDTSATAEGVVLAYQLVGASSNDMRFFGEYPDARGFKTFEFRHNVDSTLAASGNGIRFPQGLWHATNDVKLKLVARITGTSDIEDSATMPVAEAIVTGAIAYLLAGKAAQLAGATQNRDERMTLSGGSVAQLGAYYESLFAQQLQMLKIIHSEHVGPIKTAWR